MEKTEDTILELMLGTSSIHGVGKIQIKNLLKKTMEDIRKFQKGHEEDRKQKKLLTAEKQKLNQKLQILLEENKALKDLAKMPLDDEMARNVVAQRELAREKSVRDNRREHLEAKRNHKTKRYREDTESEESEEEEREYKRLKSKKKKKSRQEKSKSEGESESESEEEVIKKREKKANKVSDYIQKKSK